MKITRYYAPKDCAINASSIIQDLLVSKLTRIIDTPTAKEVKLSARGQIGSEYL
ncbi:hypothetical protein ACQCT3_11750 [Sutcliffiella horikoshii]|uniref:hypothetical protein n=1 Tax=Sutcliffiella horikoshii TaxID=79883 RepID=UPI003CEF6F1E